MFFTTQKESVSVVNVASTRTSALTDIAVTSTRLNAGIALRLRHPLVMLNLRGMADQVFRDAVRSACGCNLPVTPSTSVSTPAGEILNLGPNEWLLVTESEMHWTEKMAIPGATITDVSHGRIVVQVDGNRSRDMLAKGCAIDLHPGKFPPGTCVQTSIAQIGVILHRQQNENGFVLYAARSFAGSFWHWLTTSANEYGYDVIVPQHFSDMNQR